MTTSCTALLLNQCPVVAEQRDKARVQSLNKPSEPGIFLHFALLSEGKVGWMLCKENTHPPCTYTHMHVCARTHTHKLLTFLQLINFISQSSFRTIRIPRRNDFPIKEDPGEERLFISNSWCSLFQSLKLELIFQFSH